MLRFGNKITLGKSYASKHTHAAFTCSVLGYDQFFISKALTVFNFLESFQTSRNSFFGPALNTLAYTENCLFGASNRASGLPTQTEKRTLSRSRSVRDFGKKLNFVITAKINVDWDMKTLSGNRTVRGDALHCNATQHALYRWCSRNFWNLLNEYSNFSTWLCYSNGNPFCVCDTKRHKVFPAAFSLFRSLSFRLNALLSCAIFEMSCWKWIYLSNVTSI